MTLEKAIEFGKIFLKSIEDEKGSATYEFVETAIKALEQEPCNKTQMIDKSNFSQEQYKADLECAYDCGKSILDKIREDINNLTVYYTTKDKGINLISQRAVNRVFDKYEAESEVKND